MELLPEDDVVEGEEVGTHLVVVGRRRRRRRQGLSRYGVRIFFARRAHVEGRFRGPLGVQEDGSVDMAGGLRLVPVFLHDVVEVDLLSDHLRRCSNSIS